VPVIDDPFHTTARVRVMIDRERPRYESTPVARDRARFGYAPLDWHAAPCVTIVTPFYDGGAVFHETAASVRGQSFQQWEWIIVNDGSTASAALGLLGEYRDGDPRIRVIDHPENRGLSAARNTGVRAARSAYIVLLDSDDLLEPTAVEKWYWCLESNPDLAFVKGYSVGFGAERYLWTRGFHERQAFLEDNLVDPTSMIRRTVYTAVGGTDETIRDGLEDWDFWLRCAAAGYWGDTIPEFLNWYRRRPAHTDRWPNLRPEHRHGTFKRRLRERYPGLWNGAFPTAAPAVEASCGAIPDTLSCANRLQKTGPRLLMVVPWLTVGGADKFSLDAVGELVARGWEVTVAITSPSDHAWMPRCATLTPDVFALPQFVPSRDHPRFLRYLIASRGVEVVLIHNSELGYKLLPYLRAHCPDVAFVDFTHMEEEWKDGGYPRMAVGFRGLLDLSIVSSAHLRDWMCARGADPGQVAVCYTNVDADGFAVARERRAETRRGLGLAAETPVVLFAGRLCRQKQPRVLAAALRRLRSDGVRCAALIVGDGPAAGWLRTALAGGELGDHVRCLGAVPNDRVRDLMAAADVFFLPSAHEGISLAVYEAMAAGLCVVAADVGGQRELVAPGCGILVARGTEDEEVSRYVAALAAVLGDPARRRALGNAACARVGEHFRLEAMGERVVALFAEARRRHATTRHPPVDLALGRMYAAEVIEHRRVARFAEGLGLDAGNGDRLGAEPVDARLNPYVAPASALLYFGLRAALMPMYRAATRTPSGHWLVALKDRVKRALRGNQARQGHGRPGAHRACG
jgi:glycosyltransferase involved in cell wall biosynthesis